MNKVVLYISLFIAVISLMVIGYVFLLSSDNAGNGNFLQVEVDDNFVVDNTVDNVFEEVETTIFVSESFAFEHPTDWSPRTSSESGTVNLGIPIEGVVRQEINYRSGDYDETVSVTESLPNFSGMSELYILDSRGQARSFYDESANRQTLEYIRPGRVAGEIVVMEVEIDRSLLVQPGLEPYLEELFEGLTLVN